MSWVKHYLVALRCEVSVDELSWTNSQKSSLQSVRYWTFLVAPNHVSTVGRFGIRRVYLGLSNPVFTESPKMSKVDITTLNFSPTNNERFLDIFVSYLPWLNFADLSTSETIIWSVHAVIARECHFGKIIKDSSETFVGLGDNASGDKIAMNSEAFCHQGT